MNYDIELSRIALKNMAKIPKKDLVRIQSRLEALSMEPMPDDIKKIQGDDNLYRIRSGSNNKSLTIKYICCITLSFKETLCPLL